MSSLIMVVLQTLTQRHHLQLIVLDIHLAYGSRKLRQALQPQNQPRPLVVLQ